MFNEQLACKMFLCVVKVSNDLNHQDAIGKVNGSRNLFPTAKIKCIDKKKGIDAYMHNTSFA